MNVEELVVILSGVAGGVLMAGLVLFACWGIYKVSPIIAKTRARALLFAFVISTAVGYMSVSHAEPEGEFLTRREMQPGYAYGGTVAGVVFVLIAVPAWQAVGKKKGYGKRRRRPYVDAILDVSNHP